jgi:hypothetical protein
MPLRWGYRGEYRGSFHTRSGVGTLKLRQSVDFCRDNGPENDNSQFVLGWGLRGSVGLRDGAGSGRESDASTACGVDSLGAG